MTESIYDILKERGFIKQCTDEDAVREKLTNEKVTFYIGFDPTGDCLHVGHLLPIMCMSWLQKAGHHPIIVLGGGTAMVGDPSGKDKTREMLTLADIEKNIAGQRPLFGRFIDLEKALMVNNADWLMGLGYISFLRDIGRHFSVNKMIKSEAARLRLERDQGYSFIEFNYHLLQSYDFLVLNREHNCTLQVGGDDQWFHFCGGIELIRRETQSAVQAFTIPLQTTADGKKMGKTEAGAVWIDESRFGSYEYYQYWVNVADADVINLLKLYTFLPMSEIAGLAELKGKDIRLAKQKLAFEATALAHGKEAAHRAADAAQKVFGGTTSTDMPSFTSNLPDLIANLLADSGVCKSRSDARRMIKGGAVKVDLGEGKQKITDQNAVLAEPGIIWVGKKRCVNIIDS